MVDKTDSAAPSLDQSDIGKRVLYHPGSDKTSKRGILRYYGIPEFAGGHWCGIELDEPTGKNNGYLYGIHYFQCDDNHGVFVQANKVELDLNPPKRSHKRTGSGGSRSIPQSPVSQKEFFKSSPPPLKKVSTPSLQKTLPSQAFSTKLRQLTAKGQKSPAQPLKAFGSEVGNGNVVVRRKASTPKPVKSHGHMRRSSSGENLNIKGLMNGRLIKSASSECVKKASSKEPSPKPFRRSCHENFTAVPHRKSSKGRVQRWPVTSTPVKRDSMSPPSSSSTSIVSTGASDMEPNGTSDQQLSSSDVALMQTPGTPPENGVFIKPLETPPGDVAFIKTPETPSCETSNTSTTISSAMVSTDSSITGLQTPVSQLKLQAQNSDFIDSNRVPSPEPHVPQEKYQNTQSGSATLSHPLSVATARSADSAALPTDSAAMLTDSLATPTITVATPTEAANLPTHSANINGFTQLTGNDDTEHQSASTITTDKLLDDTVSVTGRAADCHYYYYCHCSCYSSPRKNWLCC